VWARAEITRLKTEASQLENVLAKFLASKQGKQGQFASVSGGESFEEFTAGGGRIIGFLDKGAVRKRSSKNDVILDAIDAAGPEGLDMDQIAVAAKKAGLNSSRNAIRAFCWNEKRQGRLISSQTGRYISAKFPGLRHNEPRQTNEAADPEPIREPAASVSSTPNDAERRGEVG
jgi:hypothetical protein